MSAEVELSFRAARGLDDILTWIADRSPQGARSWLERWSEICRVLSERPETCLLAPENSDHEEEIRHIVFKTRSGRKYRALFVIRGNQVFVTNLRGPGQDLVSPTNLRHMPRHLMERRHHLVIPVPRLCSGRGLQQAPRAGRGPVAPRSRSAGPKLDQPAPQRGPVVLYA